MLDGRYEILERVGAGGMGVVYRARRLMLDDLVAVKALAPQSGSGDDRSRFLLEARAAAHIRHPNVVEIYDFGDPPDGAPYIVMEYLKGPTLAQCLRDGPLPVERALEVLAPICAAVEAGHRRGVIHRDLKPANIILTASDDGREVVKVLDFGLARFDAAGPRLTGSGAIVGTAQYMSPEQARGEEAQPASDVFTLGVLLYEMVTGVAPFLGKTPLLTALAVSKGTYRPAGEVVPEIPGRLASAIDRALEVDPVRRPETPELLARLAEAGVSRHLPALPGTASGAFQPSAAQPSAAQPSAAGPSAAQPSAAQPSAAQPSAAGPSAAGPSAAQPSAAQPGDFSGAHGDDTWPAAPAFDHFVGRQRQLLRLEQEYETSVRGSGRVVLVVGETGIGKTCLVEHFARRLSAADPPAMVLRGRFFDYAGSRPPPYESFFDMLRSGSEPGVSGARIREMLAAETAGEAEGRGWRIFTALTEAFAARAGTRPLVLVLDDVHWATGADLELIDHLHRSLAHRRTLLLATARELEPRPNRRSGSAAELARWLDRLAARRAHAVLALSAFGENEVRDWFERGFGGLRIHPQDLKRIAHASGRNPYYLVEIARHLLDTGAIEWRRGWVCRPLAEIELPATVVSLVRTRLDEVGRPLRELLELASVIGDEMRVETLRLVSGMKARKLEALVDDAIGLRLLSDAGVSSGNDLRFTGATLRRVLYRDMPRRRRLKAHRRVVEALETLYRDDLDRLAPVLAYHYHAIDDGPRTLSWSIQALADALDRSDNDVAEKVLARARDALDAAPAAPADRERLDLLAGTLHRRLGQFDEAARLLRSAQRSDDESLSVAARLELARVLLDRGALPKALDTARSAARAAHGLGERRRELEARMFEATCLLRLGQNREAAARLDRLLATFDDGDPASIRSLACRERAWAELKSGAFDEAQDYARRALALAREAGDLLAQHHALSALAGVFGESGDYASALPYHRRALELSRRLSLRRREAIDLANLGEILFGAHGPDQALDHFRAALEIFVEIGDRACEGDCRVNVGRAMLARGAVAEALAMLERGRTLCEATGRTEYAGIASLHEGEALLAQGSAGAASAAYARAQECFAPSDSHYLWRADLGRARAELAAGRVDQAREHARSAAQRVAAQRARLPAEVDASGFEQAAGAVRELLAELEAVPGG